MALPTLSPEQRRAALDKAGASRRHRAETLARLQAGEITFAELLDRAGDDVVLGKTKVSRALRLGARQRQALIAALH
jgi:hypothetical protein